MWTGKGAAATPQKPYEEGVTPWCSCEFAEIMCTIVFSAYDVRVSWTIPVACNCCVIVVYESCCVAKARMQYLFH